MSDPTLVRLPQWAPRVPQRAIQRLYESDAQGIYDEELIDEVAWALYARCRSFIQAVEAVRGRAPCPVCGAVVEHHAGRDEVLRCACGWALPWTEYFRTIQHKQLSGAEPVLALFGGYMEQLATAEGPRQKMLLIDQLIHGFHYFLAQSETTRPTGVNLIEGNMHEVIAFLHRLSYGEGSTPGMRETHATWREQIARSAEAWHDERTLRVLRDEE
jgi:hypothetical protein